MPPDFSFFTVPLTCLFYSPTNCKYKKLHQQELSAQFYNLEDTLFSSVQETFFYVCTYIKYILYSSHNIVRVTKSRKMRWAEHVEHMEERTGLYRVLVWKSEGKRSLGRSRRRWEYNIKMDIHEVDVVVWTGSSCLRIGTGGGHL